MADDLADDWFVKEDINNEPEDDSGVDSGEKIKSIENGKYFLLYKITIFT